MTVIAISRLHFPVTSLGPGRRVGVWFQGCSIRCPGCISVDTWAAGKGLTTVAAVMDVAAHWLPEADGITISGGEPFDQPEALLTLLRSLHEATAVDVLVYSGHSVDTIRPVLDRAEGLIDALITDPYDRNASQTRLLRGSDNQQLHLLTSLGRRRFASYERNYEPADAHFDVMFGADGEVWLAGIPRKGDILKLRVALAAAGHRAWFSEAGSEEKR